MGHIMDEQKQRGQVEAGGAATEQAEPERPLTAEEEIAEIEKLLATETDDFQARCRLGELYFSQGRLDDALTEVKKSIEMAEGLRAEMNRSLAMYYSNLGTIYGTKGMIEEAEAQFKKPRW
jgi:tetratricopeptide (TPR) repeat protein